MTRLTNLDQSIQNALERGFIEYEIKDTLEFRPAFKHPVTGLKWIHSIVNLQRSLNAIDFTQLLYEDYDVSEYFIYNCSLEEKNSKEYFKWLAIDSITSLAISTVYEVRDHLKDKPVKEIIDVVIEHQCKPYPHLEALIRINLSKKHGSILNE